MDAAVALRLKKAQKKFADFVTGAGLHDLISLTTCGGAGGACAPEEFVESQVAVGGLTIMAQRQRFSSGKVESEDESPSGILPNGQIALE